MAYVGIWKNGKVFGHRWIMTIGEYMVSKFDRMRKRHFRRFAASKHLPLLLAFSLLIISGCDSAYLGFHAINLGEPLPENFDLPDARRSSLGLGYYGRVLCREFPAELANGTDYGLYMLVDEDQNTQCKLYFRYDFEGYGWWLVTRFRLVMEFDVPEEYASNSPSEWAISKAVTRVCEENKGLLERLTKYSQGQDKGVSRKERKPCHEPIPIKPGEFFESFREVYSNVEPPKEIKCKHIGQWAIIMSAAIINVPDQFAIGVEKHLFDGLFVIPAMFSGATEAGFHKEHFDGQYHYSVRNVGPQRVQIEIRMHKVDSVFGLKYY